MLHFFLPALAFELMVSAPVDRNFLSIPLTAAFVIMVTLAAGFAVYRLMPWFRETERPAVGVLLLAASFGNVTYLGLPVINEMLGPRYGFVAIVYDLLAATPILLTIGAFVSARYGSGKTVSTRASVLRVLKLPPLWGVAAGIAVHSIGITVPQLILDAASLMGKAVIPIMTFTVGLALDFSDMRRLPIAVPALAIKLIGAPAVAWWTGRQLGISGETLRAVTIEGAMPVMVLSLVIADEFGLDVQLAATCIAVSTVALFFTMPLMMGFFF